MKGIDVIEKLGTAEQSVSYVWGSTKLKQLYTDLALKQIKPDYSELTPAEKAVMVIRYGVNIGDVI